MKLQKLLFLNLAIAFLLAFFISLLFQKDLLRRIALSGLDFSFRLRGNLYYSSQIKIIEITDEDIAAVGRWPWDRSWHAALSKALTDMGAKAVFFDVVFSEPSNEQDDAAFEEAIRYGKNVYLPFVLKIPSFAVTDDLLPIKRFYSNIKGTGSINIFPDIDGILRKSRIIFREGSNIYPSMALKIAMDYRNQKISEITNTHVLLKGPGSETLIPLAEKDTVLINWCGKWGRTFGHYSILDVLATYKNFLDKKPSAINPEDFKESICLIGPTAVGLYDIKPTPLEPEYPGVGASATVISNILTKSFLRPGPEWINLLFLYLMCLIPAFLILGIKPLEEILCVITVGLLYFYVNFSLFKKGVVFNLAAPLLGLLISYIVIWSSNFFRISRERQEFFKMSVTDSLTGIYNIRYFKILLDSEILISKPNPDSKFCVVMADIDHFKGFNDTYGHQVGDTVLKEVAAILKASIRSSDIAARYGGEEMIVLLRGASFKDGLFLAEKMRKNIENALSKNSSRPYSVTSSFGFSIYRKGDTIESIIERADEGLYMAKSSGRNRCCTVETG